MKPEAYRETYELEETFWYFVAQKELVFQVLRSEAGGKDKNLRILDAGCGTGGLTRGLERFGTTVGVDVSDEAIRYSRSRGLQHLLKGSVTRLPFREFSFDIVTSMDVLYHRKVEDDRESLREFHRILKRGGLLILNLPAFPFLKSSHDEAVETRKRYTRGEVERLLVDTGFHIRKATYRHTLLFPFVTVVRLLKRGFPSEGSDLRPLPLWANGLLIRILRFETRILKICNLPFGSSVFCIAWKG